MASTTKSRAPQQEVAPGELPPRPEDRAQLRLWLLHHAGLDMPERGVCPGHNTPLDYLDYAFFERGPTADTLVWANRGGGKTTVGAASTLLDLLYKPGIQIKILGGSRDQSLRMYQTLCDLVEGRFSSHVSGKIKASGFTLSNGSRVEILTQSQRAVRGTRVQKMRCDEVELFDPRVWDAAQLTTRSLLLEPPADGAAAPPRVLARGGVEVFSTLHRPAGLMAQLLARTHAPLADLPQPLEVNHRRIFRWCVWDIIATCPPQVRACEGCELHPWCEGRARQAGGFLSVEDVLALKRRSSRQLWETEMLCQPPLPRDQAFPAFSAATHVRAFPADDARHILVDQRPLTLEAVVAGLDYGWKRFACLFLAMLRDDQGRRVVWVCDEYVQDQRDLMGHIAALRARTGPARQARLYYADVAGRQHDAHSGISSEKLLTRNGFHVKSRAMAIAPGLHALRLLLDPPEAWGQSAAPRFFVDPRCTHLIQALTYLRQKDPDTPIKDGIHDHLVDALRYAVMGHDSPASAPVEIRDYC